MTVTTFQLFFSLSNLPSGRNRLAWTISGQARYARLAGYSGKDRNDACIGTRRW
jgi:hypothetical protein